MPTINRQRAGDALDLGLPRVHGVVAGPPLATPRARPARAYATPLGPVSPKPKFGGFPGGGISSGMKASGIDSAGFNAATAGPRNPYTAHKSL